MAHQNSQPLSIPHQNSQQKPLNIPTQNIVSAVSAAKTKHDQNRRRLMRHNKNTPSRPIPTSQPLPPKILRDLTLMSMSMSSRSNRDREDSTYVFTNPSYYSTSSDSFHCYNVLPAGDSSDEFLHSSLAGTVELYRRHVFLCYKNPKDWPPRVESSEYDRLPRLLYAALAARKGVMGKETCLTICEGDDETETSNGDVFIFPDMLRYRRLTHFDVEMFVEEVLVNDGEWLPGKPEAITASYVFVCSHGSRDQRCGIRGPMLVSKFKEEIELYGLQGRVFVSPCSHIGRHHNAGNVIIFGSSIHGEVTGHWYGYVTPEDVSLLIQQHIIKGEILDSLWRGQMGLSEDEQKKSQEQRLQLNGLGSLEESTEMLIQMKNHEISTAACRSQDNFESCCQGNGVICCRENNDSSCYQNHESVKIKNHDAIETLAKLSADNKSNENVITRINSGKGEWRKFRSMPIWRDSSWEREDTYAALAVVWAAVSVAFAYGCYKQL